MNLYNGDCLEVMKDIPDQSIDLILTDPPYGTTTCSWDTVIDLDLMWIQLNRIIKSNGGIVLFASQPFTSKLISSNYEMFKYMWYWKKKRPGGFVNANVKPLKTVEDIVVFSKGTCANGGSNNMVYNPQGLVKVNKKWKRPVNNPSKFGTSPHRKSHKLERDIKYENFPTQILEYGMHNVGQIHPTQKPVDLMKYLIKTYTKEKELVLDFTMGSGSTGVACLETNRDFIGIELDKDYFKLAKDRINDTNTLAGLL